MTLECKQCIHYRNRLCNIFYQQHSGVVLREYAEVCRRDENKCGGKYFKKDRFANIKHQIHTIKRRFPYYIIGMYVLILQIFRSIKTAF